MSALQHHEPHRVVALARRLREDLASVAGTPLWSMPPADAGDALVLLTQARSQIDELLMRVLRHAALEDHEAVASALAAGDLRTDQARVIVDAVDELPVDVEPWVPEAATGCLLEHAVEHDAKALRVLGRRVLEVIDPARGDAAQAPHGTGLPGPAGA